MTKNNLIEQVRELNDKRTQGEWCYWPDHYKVRVDGNWVSDKLEICPTNCDNAAQHSNGQFIALAPQMAELCLEQHRQLQIAREALEYYSKASMGRTDWAVESLREMEAVGCEDE